MNDSFLFECSVNYGVMSYPKHVLSPYPSLAGPE